MAIAEQGEEEVEDGQEGEDAGEEGKVDLRGGAADMLLGDQGAGEGEGEDGEEGLQVDGVSYQGTVYQLIG